MNKIILGDCLEVMKEMADKSVDLVLTDPPYGINYDVIQDKIANSGRISNGGKWKEYNDKKWDAKTPDRVYFDEMLRIGKHQIIWGGNYFDLPRHSTWLIWNKIQRGYMTAGEMAWTSFNKSIYIFDMSRADAYINKTDGKFHPTQKPVLLFEWCLERFTKEDDIVFDPFLGSGTTAIACKHLKRKYIGVEIEPKYVKIANDRLLATNSLEVKL